MLENFVAQQEFFDRVVICVVQRSQ